MDFANRDAALSLVFLEEALQLGVAATYPQEGTVVLTLGEEELYRREVSISPERPHIHQLPLSPGSPVEGVVSLTYLGSDGEVVARYQSDMLPP